MPQVFGRYLLIQRLSRGGMGEIFLAKHGLAGFEKLAVIKKVLPHLAADEQFISRFVDEAQVAIKLSHVNVAQVFEVGRVGAEYFLALEYIEGRDLRRILSVLGHRQLRVPVDLALFIARELANGLAYAHRRTTTDGASLNLVHCDISPPNVLVSFEGETKVIDFGIAKSAMRATTTDPKLGFGKFGYMAPEQLIRGGVVDYRTDIYAAGVVLFELLTGTRLYEAGPEPDYRGLARKVARGEHPLPSHIDRQLAPYDALVATALRPRPEERYQSAAELRDAIQQCLVAVNPTISTDQLGAFMREMFGDEMAAQRELHDRVASAHLSDFQEQFHTQTISTVSFALAQLPLPPPEATGVLRRRGRSTAPNPVVRGRTTGPNAAVPSRTTGANPVVAGSPVVDLRPRPQATFERTAPLTGELENVTLSDAATLIGGFRPPPRQPRRHLLAIAAGTAIGVVVVVGVWAFAAGGGRPPAVAPAAQVLPPPSVNAGITVEPIPVSPALGSAHDEAAAPAEPAPSAPAVEPAPAPSAPGPSHRATHEAPHRGPHRAGVAASPSLTREQLGQKFQLLRREYDAYKARFGSRLEKEWGELATFIQYQASSADDSGRREAARRIDEFRSRMRD